MQVDVDSAVDKNGKGKQIFRAWSSKVGVVLRLVHW